MKFELLEILKEKHKELMVNQHFVDYINQLLDFYDNVSLETKEKMTSVFEYYNYVNRSKFVDPAKYPHLKNTYPHVMLNKELGEYRIELLLDYDGGICKVEDQFKLLVLDPEIYYDESLESNPEMYEIHTTIIISWLVSLWQEIKGNQYGVVVKYDEHGESYFLNDQKWNDHSLNQFSHKIKNNESPDLDYPIAKIYNEVLKK